MSKIFLRLFILIGLFINGLSASNQNDEPLKPSFMRRITEIDEAILCETRQIQDLQSAYGTTDEVLWLYNELGISWFFKGEYLSALDKFNYILQQKYHDEESLLIGAALWGKAICHACLDMSEEMMQDFQTLELYFKQLFQYNCRSKRERMIFTFSDADSHYSNLILKTQVRFENPNENISAAQCRDRVNGSAKAIRLFITPLIRDTSKRALFMSFIQVLEDAGLNCCRDGSIWVTCVTPIMQKLENWKVLGIPPDPAWD